MKRFLAYLFIVLGLGLTFSVSANDIENFQIEQISIGDSLLDYYSKKQIDKRSSYIKLGKKKFKEYKKFYKDKNNELYDRVVLYFKSDDIKYIVKQISGRKYFINQIDNCYKTQNIISDDIEEILENSEKIESGIKKQKRFPDGDNYIKENFFYLNNRSTISIVCYDYSKKDTKSKDRLSVVFSTYEYSKWLNNL
jgi:hypothetical protein